MILTQDQYIALQQLFPDHSVDVFSTEQGAKILVTETPPGSFKFNDDSADSQIEREVDDIERLAKGYADTYYGGRWDTLEPGERLGLRARARRFLGY